MKQNAMATKFIAHRGYSLTNIDNTIESFIKAGESSFYGIETDIRWTKDGIVVCCHDEYISSQGIHYLIKDHTYQELKKLPLDNHLSKKGYLCLFDDYLSICQKYHKHPIIEFKVTPTQDIVNDFLSSLKEKKMLDSCIFISFGYEILLKIKKYDPHIPCQYLISEKENLYKGMENGLSGDILYSLIDEEVIKTYHQASLKVNAWTINDENLKDDLIKMNIDFITSNYLEK
jgi:glycerophosphoryl diester phosphodiesterase